MISDDNLYEMIYIQILLREIYQIENKKIIYCDIYDENLLNDVIRFFEYTEQYEKIIKIKKILNESF